MADRRYRDRRWLKEKYHGEGKTQKEIADICDVGADTVHTWMGKHNISTRDGKFKKQFNIGEETLRTHYVENKKTLEQVAEIVGFSRQCVRENMEDMGFEIRDRGGHPADARHKDAEWLREKYHHERMSTRDIANELGLNDETVRRWMKKHGIERRDRTEWTKLSPACFHTDGAGYERWKSKGDNIRVHRLLAVAKEGFDAVCGKDVHHIDPEGRGRPGIPWLNTYDHIEVLNPEEHTRRHQSGGQSGRV